jgi:hypothetical protein
MGGIHPACDLPRAVCGVGGVDQLLVGDGMTRDDIIRLAREAGWNGIYSKPLMSIRMQEEDFLRFARLVIAHERTRLKEELAPSGSFVSWNNTKCNPLADPMMQSKSAWDDGYASGVAAEREACAKVCEEEIKRVKPIYSVTAENCVKAIRARGQK